MTPDPEQRLPRELLKELIEEGSEPHRDFRRLHFLRGWGHGKTKQILTRG